MRKHRDIKLMRTERRSNHLVSQPNFHTARFFTENLLEIEMNKTEIHMRTPVYLGLSILELSKILLHRFKYDNAKPKYSEKGKIMLYGYRHGYGYIQIWFHCISKNR